MQMFESMMKAYAEMPVEKQLEIVALCAQCKTNPLEMAKNLSVVADGVYNLCKQLVDAHVNDGLDITALLEQIQGETPREDV